MSIVTTPTVMREHNMQFMAMFPDKFFDLVIDDPQYGIGESSKNHKSRATVVKQKNGSVKHINLPLYQSKDWDDAPEPQAYFDELFRVSKHQIIWGENHYFFEQKARSSGRIVWDKVNTADFSDCEIAWTSLFSSVRQIEYMWNGMMQGKSLSEGRTPQGNKKLNEKRIHCTQKPVLLYAWQLNKFADKGWRIGDFHLGSGSHRIAADKLGFDFWACEADQDHFMDQEARFKAYKRDKPKLFVV